MKKFVVLAIVATACLCPSGIFAAIVTYELEGELGNQLFTAGLPALNVAALDLTRGAGLSPNNAGDSFNSFGWDTLAANDYVSFGFTVDPGFFATMTDITFTGRSSNTGPSFLAIRSSLDSFTSDLHTFTQSGTSGTPVTFDAAGLGPITGGIEFRIFSLNTTSANGENVGSNGTWRIGFRSSTDLIIGGSVNPVPEPSSIVLFSLIAGFRVLQTRRRCKESSAEAVSLAA